MPEVPGSLAPTEPPTVLSAEAEANLGALHRALKRAPEFCVVEVIVRRHARAEVLRRLAQWSGKDGVPALRVVGPDEAAAIVQRSERIEGGLVIGTIDPWLAVDGDDRIQALNLARDRLWQLLAGPIVIVVSPQLASTLARRAPDLHSVRIGTYEIEKLQPLPSPDELQRAILSFLPAASAGEIDRERERLESAQAAPEPPSKSALADGWNRLAKDLGRQLRWEETLDAARRAAVLARDDGYLHGQSDALLTQGRARGAQGDKSGQLACFAEALGLGRRAGDQQWVLQILLAIGLALMPREPSPGGVDEAAVAAARERLEEAKAIGEQLQDPSLVEALVHLATLDRMRGDWDSCRQHLDQAFLARERLSDHASTGPVRLLLAIELSLAMKLPEATVCWRELMSMESLASNNTIAAIGGAGLDQALGGGHALMAMSAFLKVGAPSNEAGRLLDFILAELKAAVPGSLP